MNSSSIVEKAKETAKRMAERVEKAYIKAVTDNLDAYDSEMQPDEEDFFAWAEGYGWEE